MNDGGPAFPRSAFASEKVTFEDCEINDSQEGMSLLDWLAGQAMVAMLPIYAGMNGGEKNGIGTDHIVVNVSIHAYRMARAMLAAREKK